MRLLLIGRTGQLGGEILRNAAGHDVHAPARDELDITDPVSIESQIALIKPDVVINTAAFHNVPLCEDKPFEAFRANMVAVRDLALECKKSEAVFVTFSTDYVFDGMASTPYKETDLPRPMQVYGMSRLAGEQAALCAYPQNTLVIRTCGLYGISGARSKGGNFVDKRIGDAATPGPMQMSSEQTVAPTYTSDLSRAVLELISQGAKASGIYHLVNEGQCTWYEFTKAIYEIAGVEKEVIPVDRGGMDRGVQKPLYSVLENNRARALGITMPHWRDALERYMGTKGTV